MFQKIYLLLNMKGKKMTGRNRKKGNPNMLPTSSDRPPTTTVRTKLYKQPLPDMLLKKNMVTLLLFNLPCFLIKKQKDTQNHHSI
jgi:hypothetical protein